MRIDTGLPGGEVSADWAEAEGGDVILIAHGAGSGKDHAFLVGLSAALHDHGLSTLRFNFPYSEAGRRMPGPAAHAIATWQAVTAWARERRGSGRVIASGKSYGGRMASMAAAEGMPVDGLVYLGYPLHPPGRPDRPRIEHLPAVVPPQLFVEGGNDPFIQPVSQLEEAVASCQDARIAWIEGGGHSFEVKGAKRPAEEVGAALAPLIVEFTASLPGGPR